MKPDPKSFDAEDNELARMAGGSIEEDRRPSLDAEVFSFPADNEDTKPELKLCLLFPVPTDNDRRPDVKVKEVF